MGYAQSSKFCPVCNQQRLVQRKTTSNGFHAILSFLTFGMWLFVWGGLVLASLNNPWRCTQCGTKIP